MMRPFALLALASLAVTGPAFAQPSPAAPQSGLVPTSPGPAASGVGATATGGLPETTGSTTAVGRTKPPGDALGDQEGTRPDLEKKSRELDQKINKGICVGCK